MTGFEVLNTAAVNINTEVFMGTAKPTGLH